MVIKRPFPESDWQGTPKSVQDYVEYLEVRLNKNSRNSSKPPSLDDPFQKAESTGSQGEENNDRQDQDSAKDTQDNARVRNRGGQKGHKGHKQKLLTPNLVIPQNPSVCSCGCTSFDLDKLEPFYTHQQLEIPKIKPDVTHIVLNKAP